VGKLQQVPLMMAFGTVHLMSIWIDLCSKSIETAIDMNLAVCGQEPMKRSPGFKTPLSALKPEFQL
jgi:hypothetical protein